MFDSSVTLALDGDGGLLHAPAALCPLKEPPMPIEYQAGWTFRTREISLSSFGNRKAIFCHPARRNHNNDSALKLIMTDAFAQWFGLEVTTN